MVGPALLLVDNFDSFTFMLADTLVVAGAAVEVVRADSIDAEEALARGRDGIVVSPGPGHPRDAALSLALARRCLELDRPFLGVCLGHQALGLACGGEVGRVAPMHGKVGPVRHDGSGLFAGLDSPLPMTRYHSLALTRLPDSLVANAWSEDGVVMGVRHRAAPAHGVQFHPESIASEAGPALVAAFVDLCRARG